MIRFFCILLLTALLTPACTSDDGNTDSKDSAEQSSHQAADTASSSGILASVAVGEFASRLAQDPHALLVDVRTPAEREQEGFIQPEGVDVVHWDYNAPDFQDRVASADPDIHIYIYCASGMRSARAGDMLVGRGVREVYNLLGGIGAWKAEGNSIIYP